MTPFNGTGPGFRTRAIHGGHVPRRHRGATAVPLYSTSSYAFGTSDDLAQAFEGRRPDDIYSRISNPTVRAFEQRLALLEGGVGSFATASGMAAVGALFATLTESGSRVIFAQSLFGGTLLYLREVAGRAGVSIDLVDMDSDKAFAAALAKDPKPRFVFFETLGNPRLDIPPIAERCAAAAAAGVPTVIDATLSSPALFDGKSAGAAIVMHSLTKYITGNGTTIGGAVTDLGTFDWSTHESNAIAQAGGRVDRRFAFLAALRRQGALNGGVAASPFSAFLACLGLETLDLRMAAHVENATTLAEFLATHPAVTKVRYPGHAQDPYHTRAGAYFRGGVGAVLCFDVGSRKAAFAVADALKLATRASNLGDAKTLVIHPASTIFHDCTEEERRFSGVTEGLLRVSVGIENKEDLINDFDRALAAAGGGRADAVGGPAAGALGNAAAADGGAGTRGERGGTPSERADTEAGHNNKRAATQPHS